MKSEERRGAGSRMCLSERRGDVKVKKKKKKRRMSWSVDVDDGDGTLMIPLFPSLNLSEQSWH